MNILCDVFLLVVIVIFAWIGKKRGFVLTFFDFFRHIISFASAFLFAKPISNILCNRFFHPIMSSYFSKKMLEFVSEESFDFEKFIEKFSGIFSLFPISIEDFSKSLQEQGTLAVEQIIEKLAKTLAIPLANTISYIFAFLSIFVMISLLIRFLIKILNVVAKLPILKFSNETLGLVIGIMWGILLTCVFAEFLVFFAPLLQASGIPFVEDFIPEKTLYIKFITKLNFVNF